MNKYLILAISLSLCFTVAFGMSVSSFMDFLGASVNTIGYLGNTVLNLDGGYSSEETVRIPLMSADLGVLADKTEGIVNIAQYIQRHFVPEWILQELSMDYVSFQTNVYVYPNYYYGVIETTGKLFQYTKRDIYSGRLIRLDIEVISVDSPSASALMQINHWSVYVLPREYNSLRYYMVYSLDQEGYLTERWNNINEYINYTNLTDYEIIDVRKGKLGGKGFIAPPDNGRAYKLTSALYTNVPLSSEEGHFLKFMKG